MQKVYLLCLAINHETLSPLPMDKYHLITPYLAQVPLLSETHHTHTQPRSIKKSNQAYTRVSPFKKKKNQFGNS